MIRGVLQQLSHGHGVFFGPAHREVNNALQIFVLQPGQKLPHVHLDFAPGFYKRFHRWVIVRIEARATLWPAATIEPTPFGAQNMNHRVPDGSIASTHRLRELFRGKL